MLQSDATQVTGNMFSEAGGSRGGIERIAGPLPSPHPKICLLLIDHENNRMKLFYTHLLSDWGKDNVQFRDCYMKLTFEKVSQVRVTYVHNVS